MKKIILWTTVFLLAISCITLAACGGETTEYTVTFTVDGEIYDTVTGTVFGTPVQPVKEGYSFSGWYLDEECTQKYTSITQIKEDGTLTVYAGWKEAAAKNNSFTVTFKDWDGSLLGTVIVAKDAGVATADVPQPPARQGYKWNGWDGIISRVTADVTVTAQYTAERYSVSFYSKAGSLVLKETKDFNYTYDALPVAVAEYNAVYDGFRFTAWKTAEGQRFETPYRVIGDVSFYADYVPVYAVYYNGNNAQGQVPTETAKAAGDVFVLKDASTLTGSNGLVFGGWNTQADGKGTSYSSGASYTMPSNAVTFYAVWKEPTYTVTFKDWNNNTLAAVTDVPKGGTATPPVYSEDTGYDYAWSGSYTNVNADVTVTLVRTLHRYTVSFYADAQLTTLLGTDSTAHGTAANAPAFPTDEGYTYGWSGAIDSVTSAISVYLVKTPKKFDLRFLNEDSTLISSRNEDYNYALAEPTPPETQTGYQFRGWYNQSYTTKYSFPYTVKGNTVFYAKIVRVYNVTYLLDNNVIGEIPTETAKAQGEQFILPTAESASLSKPNYAFAGWQLVTPEGASYEGGDSFTMPDSDVELVALWTAVGYAVTFKDWNGTPLGTIQHIQHGGTAVAPEYQKESGYVYQWDKPLDNITQATEITLIRTVDKLALSLSDTSLIPIGTTVTLTALAVQPLAGDSFTYVWSSNGEVMAGETGNSVTRDVNSAAVISVTVSFTLGGVTYNATAATDSPIILTPNDATEPFRHYSDLNLALKDAESGDTVTLLEHYVLDEDAEVKDGVTLKLNFDLTQRLNLPNSVEFVYENDTDLTRYLNSDNGAVLEGDGVLTVKDGGTLIEPMIFYVDAYSTGVGGTEEDPILLYRSEKFQLLWDICFNNAPFEENFPFFPFDDYTLDSVRTKTVFDYGAEYRGTTVFVLCDYVGMDVRYIANTQIDASIQSIVRSDRNGNNTGLIIMSENSRITKTYSEGNVTIVFDGDMRMGDFPVTLVCKGSLLSSLDNKTAETFPFLIPKSGRAEVNGNIITDGHSLTFAEGSSIIVNADGNLYLSDNGGVHTKLEAAEGALIMVEGTITATDGAAVSGCIIGKEGGELYLMFEPNADATATGCVDDVDNSEFAYGAYVYRNGSWTSLSE